MVGKLEGMAIEGEEGEEGGGRREEGWRTLKRPPIMERIIMAKMETTMLFWIVGLAVRRETIVVF